LDREIVIIKGEGALITEVVEDSPADTAGLLVGDTILSVDGDEIEPGTALADLITDYEPGEVVKLEVLRDGEELEIEVELAENPEKPGQAYLGVVYSSGMPGMQFDKDGGWRFFFDDKLPIPYEDFEDKDLPFFHHEFPGIHPFEDLPDDVENAIIIGEVIEGTPADEAGLKEDDLILYLDGDPVDELKSFVADIQSRDPGDQVNLTIFREVEEIEISVTLAEHPDDPSNGYLGVIVSGVVKMNFEGEMPGDFEFDLDKELKLPGGDA
jgi:C-terminal processing protease CtpA/Prc